MLKDRSKDHSFTLPSSYHLKNVTFEIPYYLDMYIDTVYRQSICIQINYSKFNIIDSFSRLMTYRIYSYITLIE